MDQTVTAYWPKKGVVWRVFRRLFKMSKWGYNRKRVLIERQLWSLYQVVGAPMWVNENPCLKPEGNKHIWLLYDILLGHPVVCVGFRTQGTDVSPHKFFLCRTKEALEKLAPIEGMERLVWIVKQPVLCTKSEHAVSYEDAIAHLPCIERANPFV